MQDLHPAQAAPRRPAIQPERCTGCGRCVAACGEHLLSLEPQRWRKFAVLHDALRCTGCSDCAVVCPFGAIRMRAAPPAVPAGVSVSAPAGPRTGCP